MDLTLADQYYLKAESNYPYYLESMIEDLNYALSYDDEHTQSLCLLGKIYMYVMKEYQAANHYFQMAIISDRNYPDAYKYLSLLKIWNGKYIEAQKIIERGMQVPGMDKAKLMIIHAQLYECKREFDQAKQILKRAKLCSLDNGTIELIDNQISRVKKKAKMVKLKDKKRKK